MLCLETTITVPKLAQKKFLKTAALVLLQTGWPS